MSDSEFYDLVYEAWCRGRNPDEVSEDRYDDMIDRGYCPDEIRLSDVLPSFKREDDDESTA